MTNNLTCEIEQLPVWQLAKKLDISYDFARFLKSEVNINRTFLTCNTCILKCPLNKYGKNWIRS
ncbi:MAG: hypothetical protein LBT99_00950 [Bifidobacteriaceae bacterium]|jgi:epoxyqueuosine reductase QueG|nr:hypothetical protein [Bifidobacteriaceae bacterium]